MPIIEAIRGITGRKWNPEAKVWSIPATSWHCHEVQEVLRPFGFEFDDAIISCADCEAEVPDMEFPEGLREFQKTAVEFMAAVGGRCIIADEMGLGKTVEALAYVKIFSAKVLVIAPANVIYKWEVECKKWVGEKTVAVYPTGKGDLGDEDIHIMSYGIMASRYEQIKDTPYDTVIFDEAHMIKNSKAIRTRVSKALVKAGIPNVFFLSGTPFMNRPSELFPLLNMLDPVGYANFYDYARKYCNTPEAPIWMGDYSFKQLGDVEVGDVVIGWKPREVDARTGTYGSNLLREQLCRSRVLSVNRRTAPIVRITLQSGNVIRCTADHMWRTQNSRNSGSEYAPAKVGQPLRHVIDPVPTGHGNSWLSGIYDGEACGISIAQSKEHNPEICARIEKELNNRGYEYSFKDNKYSILGGQQEYVRFINQLNPTRRVTAQNDRMILTYLKRGLDTVVSIEPDGEGEVISMKTETGNYVAWGYASKNCGAIYENGMWFFPPNGVSNIQELAERLSKVMIRRTKGQVLPELPDLTRVSVPVVIENMTAYKQAVKDIRHWLKEQDKEVLNPEHVLTRLNTLRQIVGEGKIPAAVELAESVLQDGKRVVLFAHHKAIVTSLAKSLHEYGVGIISGDTKPKDRQILIKNFLSSNEVLISDSKNDGNINVMIITVAGAEGIDLFSASDIIFVEREWTPAKEEQAESRLHRMGQKQNVSAYYIIAKKTIDEKLDKVIKDKREIFGSIISQDIIVETILDNLWDI